MKKLLLLTVLAITLFAAWHYRILGLPENGTVHQIIGEDAVLAKMRELNRLESTAFHIDAVIKTEKQGTGTHFGKTAKKACLLPKAA